MNIKGRLEKIAGAHAPAAPCEPFGPEWIDRADALLRGMPDAQAEGMIDDLLKGGHSRRARAFTAAASRGLTFAEVRP